MGVDRVKKLSLLKIPCRNKRAREGLGYHL